MYNKTKMSLQDLIDSASSGSVINITDNYTLSASLNITKPITLVGRQDSSGVRPMVTITTAANGFGVIVNSSDVTLKGIDFVHSSPFSFNDGCIVLAPGGVSVMNDDGLMVNENIVIDDCRVEYSKFGVTSKAKSFNVVNSDFHCRVTTTTTARAIAVYSNDGDILIDNNTYTTAGNLSIEGLHINYATNDGYVNKHSGTITYTNNTSNISTSRKFIIFEVGAEKNPVGAPNLNMVISNNNISVGTGSTFFVMQPFFVDSFESIGTITVTNNTTKNTFSNGLLQIDVNNAGSSAAKTHNLLTNTPKFIVFGNTVQTAIVETNKYVIENVLVFTGFTSLPSNIDSILSTSPPSTSLSPGSQTLLDILLPLAKNLSTTTDASEIIGLSSPLGANITLKKKSNIDPVVSETHFISSLQHKLVLLNASSIPSNIGRVMAVFGPTTRAQIESKNVVLQFAVKFVNNTTNQYETNLHQEYRIELPTLANRQYVKIYKEGSDGATHFITNAYASVSGSSSNTFYTFNLESNSLYSVVDSGVFVSSGGIGSDPHITTFSGKHTIMHSVRGKNREVNILGDRYTKMVGHIQGYQNGDFLNKVKISHLNTSVCEIDFHKKKVTISNNRVAKVIDSTNSQLVGNSNNSNRGRQTLFLDLMNPGGMYLYIDWNTRYVCPIFNQVLQNQDLKGVLI